MHDLPSFPTLREGLGVYPEEKTLHQCIQAGGDLVLLQQLCNGKQSNKEAFE